MIRRKCTFVCLFVFKATCSLIFLHLLKSQPGHLRSVKKYSLYKNLTARLIGDGRMVFLYQNDPSKRLCFIFDLIVSLLTGTFINSLMANQKLAAECFLSFPYPGFGFTLSDCLCLMDVWRRGGDGWRVTYLRSVQGKIPSTFRPVGWMHRPVGELWACFCLFVWTDKKLPILFLVFSSHSCKL